jgi:hypothetical protein
MRLRFVYGPLAQSAEHLPFKQRVAGSSPARLITQSIENNHLIKLYRWRPQQCGFGLRTYSAPRSRLMVGSDFVEDYSIAEMDMCRKRPEYDGSIVQAGGGEEWKATQRGAEGIENNRGKYREGSESVT